MKYIYKDLAEAFTEANPDMHIQLVSSDELLGPVDFTQGVDHIQWPDVPLVADVFPINLPMADDVIATRRVRDLAPFVEADADFQPEDFYPGALEGYRRDNGTWAIPVALDVSVVAYHKAMFDATGVAYPEPGWTWEDLINRAQALRVREGNEVVQWGFAFNVYSPIRLQRRAVSGKAWTQRWPPHSNTLCNTAIRAPPRSAWGAVNWPSLLPWTLSSPPARRRSRMPWPRPKWRPLR